MRAAAGTGNLGELERVIEGWDGEQVLVRFDAPTGSWIFICTTRGDSARQPAGRG